MKNKDRIFHWFASEPDEKETREFEAWWDYWNDPNHDAIERLKSLPVSTARDELDRLDKIDKLERELEQKEKSILPPPSHATKNERRKKIVMDVCEKLIAENKFNPSSNSWPRSLIFTECSDLEPHLFGDDDSNTNFKRPYSQIRKELRSKYD